jgi:phosphate transport system protein
MSPYSARERFDRRLQGLLDQVLVLGNMVEQAVAQSLAALHQRDHIAARRVYAGDQHINEKRYAIENECVTLIATQQPMARDVRFLAANLEIITELERIGDYAKGIAKITLLLADEPDEPSVSRHLNHMAELGLSMLRRGLDAFVAGDVESARAIPAQDDAVDNLYNRIYQELTHRMVEDTISIDHANQLIWAAHNLERLADRVSNICERTVYISTGDLQELDPGDDLAFFENDVPKVSGSSKPKILFLCTHNSARSQMAEAFLHKNAGDRYEVHSAGLEPGEINPYTRRVMAEVGLDLAGQRSKSLSEYLGKVQFAYLITVCDHADEQCPFFPGQGTRLHWSFEDPSAAVGREDEKLARFRQVRDVIEARILEWISYSPQ